MPGESTEDRAPLNNFSIKSQTFLSPATIAGEFLPSSAAINVARPSKEISALDGEAAQRERGNEEYKNGNFAAAIKAYTICLGMKSNNVAAFSNRASAYLKTKEFAKAEADCSSVLRIDTSHIKALVRRASARNALGKHRSALQDLLLAQTLDGGGASASSIRVEVYKTRELLRSAVNRAPFIPIQCVWKEGFETPPAGPDMPCL